VKLRALRVLRGGSCSNGSWNLRLTIRYRREPVLRYWGDGFRIVVVRRKP
jgi:formylglycine-generating enzyme required for sulfatase activity